MERSGTWAVVGGVVLGLGVIATVAMVTLNQGPRNSACSGSAVGGSLGGPFTLVDENGATVTDKDVITAPTLVYFGYTFCPDVCPMDSQRNAFALEDLEEDDGIIGNALFITIDPQRDTPEAVRDFTDSFHERMLGLTGSDAQIAEAAQAYRVFYSRDDSGDDDFYLMNHSTFTYLVTPESGFVDVFSRETSPEDMAARVACHVEAGM